MPADEKVTSSYNVFIVETLEVKGKFDLKKAEKLNIPKGPLYGLLKAGKAITLQDGTVIQPEEVVDAPLLSRYCIVLPQIPLEDLSLVETWASHCKIKRYYRRVYPQIQRRNSFLCRTLGSRLESRCALDWITCKHFSLRSETAFNTESTVIQIQRPLLRRECLEHISISRIHAQLPILGASYPRGERSDLPAHFLHRSHEILQQASPRLSRSLSSDGPRPRPRSQGHSRQ